MADRFLLFFVWWVTHDFYFVDPYGVARVGDPRDEMHTHERRGGDRVPQTERSVVLLLVDGSAQFIRPSAVERRCSATNDCLCVVQ